MPRGSPSPKVTITIDPAIYEGVVLAAEREQVSVSAWLTEAARHRLQVAAGLAAIAEWEAEHGGFTDEELDAAERRIAPALERMGWPS